jgi:MFS family permease
MQNTFNWKWISLLFAGRFLTSSAFFMYVGTLPFLLNEWNLSGTEAGAIQTAAIIGFAISLFVASYACDFFNPSRILIIGSVGNCVAASLFYLFAHDFFTGLIFNLLLGLFQGGIYGPSMVLVSEKYEKKHRGLAMGFMLGGQSLGYAISLTSSFIIASYFSTKSAFLFCSIVSFVGIFVFGIASFNDWKKKYNFDYSLQYFSVKKSDQSKYLVRGYIAHSMELFGVWSWLPVFLSFVLIQYNALSPLLLGVVIGLSLHLSGALANIISGFASDIFGRKKILVFFAFASAMFSFLMGWLTGLHWMIIAILALMYSFLSIGDSGVLTSALTENTERNVLGRALAYRSILGIGLGSITPAMFGYILDITNNHQSLSESTNWVYAFSFLGVLGLVATYNATRTDKKVLG